MKFPCTSLSLGVAAVAKYPHKCVFLARCYRAFYAVFCVSSKVTIYISEGKSIRKTVILLMDFYLMKAFFLKMCLFPGVRKTLNSQRHSNRTSDFKKSFGP